MTNYVFTYHGGSGMAETPEEQEKTMAAWMAWFADMGDKVVDGGNPFMAHRTVAADGSVRDGGPAAELGGYSVVRAESFEEATTLAKGCPVLADGGSVQVSEAIAM